MVMLWLTLRHKFLQILHMGACILTVPTEPEHTDRKYQVHVGMETQSMIVHM